ncbi:unnamed protein product [Protopolystoma xenopodis]|uniref:Uncharacterized protein n=1 Tax=Protopolystoma xenopodis TaxID=117903 RepID=A0A3S5AVK4_9PLAT|nr:unnamed protein product [Protopolystoma xenopodis]
MQFSALRAQLTVRLFFTHPPLGASNLPKPSFDTTSCAVIRSNLQDQLTDSSMLLSLPSKPEAPHYPNFGKSSTTGLPPLLPTAITLPITSPTTYSTTNTTTTTTNNSNNNNSSSSNNNNTINGTKSSSDPTVSVSTTIIELIPTIGNKPCAQDQLALLTSDQKDAMTTGSAMSTNLCLGQLPGPSNPISTTAVVAANDLSRPTVGRERKTSSLTLNNLTPSASSIRPNQGQSRADSAPIGYAQLMSSRRLILAPTDKREVDTLTLEAAGKKDGQSCDEWREGNDKSQTINYPNPVPSIEHTEKMAQTSGRQAPSVNYDEEFICEEKLGFEKSLVP